jgi:hypothetical protein
LAKDKPQSKGHDRDAVLVDLKTKLDMLDERLDNMDSVVSALVERVMSQPFTVGFTCPHCGRSTEISVIGNTKPSVKG